ncbi:MAG: hypothetical protein M5U19_20080 [Microthrixaceae bacterium]|nr:hypothetical protein [Microthrixaceae bacterium]
MSVASDDDPDELTRPRRLRETGSRPPSGSGRRGRPDGGTQAVDGAGVVRRPRKRRSTTTRRRRRILVGILAFVVVAALLVAGYGWWTYQRVDRVDVDLAEVAHGRPRNYLVVGSDSRESVDADDPNARCSWARTPRAAGVPTAWRSCGSPRMRNASTCCPSRVTCG